MYRSDHRSGHGGRAGALITAIAIMVVLLPGTAFANHGTADIQVGRDYLGNTANMFHIANKTMYVGQTAAFSFVAGSHTAGIDTTSLPAGAAAFRSPGFVAQAGEPLSSTYTYTFAVAGTYNYYCSVHASQADTATTYDANGVPANGKMVGRITVAVDSSAPTWGAGTPTATAVSASQINLTWPAATDAETGISQYRVFEATGATRPAKPGTASATPTGTTLSRTGLTAGARVSFIVSPSQLEIEVKPGGTASASVRVYNKQDTALELHTYVRDIEIPPSDLIAQGDLAFSASAWTQFREPVIKVAPGGTADAILAVRVPSTAAPGGYNAFGYMQTAATSSDGGSNVGVSARVGVTLLLDVVPPGTDLDRSARMSNFDVSVHWDGLFHPVVRTSATIDNVGDTHVLIGGVQTYRGWPGSDTSQQKVGPYTLLRGTRHTLTSEWIGPLIGRVTVTSEIVYQRGPDDLPAIVVQRTVWIIPWHLIVPLLVGLAFLGLWRVRRRRRRHQPRHAAKYHGPAAPQRRRQHVATSSASRRR